MNDPSALVASAPEPGPARAARWMREALRLFGRAPFRLIGLALAPFVLEGLLQLVPVVGVLLSKILPSLLMAGQYVALERVARGEKPRFADLGAGFRAKLAGPLLALALPSLVVFGTQVIVAWAVYGPAAIDAVVLGHATAHPELLHASFQLVLILPGLLPAALIAFAMPLVVLGGRPPFEAFATSVRRMLGAPLVLLTLLAAWAALFTAGMLVPLAGLVLIVASSPWTLATIYAGYRDWFSTR